MTTTYAPQTTTATMERIAAGVDPWIAYRDFLAGWTYLPDARPGLVAAKPVAAESEHDRWAALLAATAEALCERDGIPVPAWTRDPAFCLAEPWYLYEGTGRIRGWLHECMPKAFAERNIWSEDRLLRRT